MAVDEETRSFEELVDFIKSSRGFDFSGYKRPIAYTGMDPLPANAVGKIDKVALRRAHAKGTAAHRSQTNETAQEAG